MLLNEQQYQHAFHLLCRLEPKSLFLLEFEQWFQQTLNEKYDGKMFLYMR